MYNTAMVVFGFSIIFIATALGSSIVFFFKKDISPKLNTLFFGFAAGIMIAASVWSLLIPSIEGAEGYGTWRFIPAVIGFIAGGVFIVLLDKIIPRFKSAKAKEKSEHFLMKKSAKLFLAVTIHNVPEGLAVGFAFGAAVVTGAESLYVAALGLAVGIAIQNFPEGAAVALPLKQETGSRGKAFLYGISSGIVEPVFAIIGYFLATYITVAQPWLLSFAAGAMFFVVVEDLIPDTDFLANLQLGTWGIMIGFVIMMMLDVAL